MPKTREMIYEAGLGPTFEYWTTVAYWAGWITSISAIIVPVAGAILWFANHSTGTRIPNLAAETMDSRRQEYEQRPAKTWPVWYLQEEGWTVSSLPDGLNLFTSSVEQSESGATTDILVKDGEDTIVQARIIALADNFIWPFGEAEATLNDGERSVELTRAIADTGAATLLRQNPASSVDIIGIGLESSVSGNSDDEYRELSYLRGRRLALAIEQVLSEPISQRSIRYRSLGLGRSLQTAQKDSDAERRQRSALIVIVLNDDHERQANNLERTLDLLLQGLNGLDVQLDRYEYSCAVNERLSPPLGSLEQWELPKILPENTCLNASADESR